MNDTVRLPNEKLPVEFDYSEEFRLLLLASLKDREGRPEHERWYRMALSRVDFQRRHFLPALSRFVDCRGLLVLEIGCGTAPSSIVMAEQGAHVLAVDIDPRMLELARLRVCDHGLADKIQLRHVETTERLDFADESFDLVVCNGVLEHVQSGLRPAIIHEMWRVLRRGGHLFIGETPNRLWPIDDHTTGLWWIHYLPGKVAKRYAVLRKRIKPSDDLIAMGGLGCLSSRVVRAVPAQEARVLNRNKSYSWLARQRLAGPKTWKKRFVFIALSIMQTAILKPLLHLSIDDLLPYLTICIEKLV